jgi:hypothetical protein
MRRVVLKSPVLENCTPGSVRGALGNQRPYLDKIQLTEENKGNEEGAESWLGRIR